MQALKSIKNSMPKHVLKRTRKKEAPETTQTPSQHRKHRHIIGKHGIPRTDAFSRKGSNICPKRCPEAPKNVCCIYVRGSRGPSASRAHVVRPRASRVDRLASGGLQLTDEGLARRSFTRLARRSARLFSRHDEINRIQRLIRQSL